MCVDKVEGFCIAAVIFSESPCMLPATTVSDGTFRLLSNLFNAAMLKGTVPSSIPFRLMVIFNVGIAFGSTLSLPRQGMGDALVACEVH